ncbi:tannase and feruloyl esterase [Thozetella sp. PMI_491]|nr:tannase and feruloyl esterase [Thozetella sp. PMI_491]
MATCRNFAYFAISLVGRYRALLISSYLLLAFLQPTRANFLDSCLAFAPTTIVKNAELKEHSFVSSGTNLTFPNHDATCNRPSQIVLADLCRVALHIPTSSRSNVVLELWLPEAWNGRLLTVGNGGLDGCVHYEDLAYASTHGFAVVGTNNGHNGTSGIQFLNNEDVVIDFAWRAIHVAVATGKALLGPFYNSTTQAKSYYLGCSLGGRQGIKAADMFPDDFDGIVAGAPAVDFNNLYSWRARFFPITGNVNSSDFITPTLWQTTIHDEVLRQCDKLDGVADGIIEDPTLCYFNPETLSCGNGGNGATINSTLCLTPTQIQTIHKVFSPTLWPNGTFFFPRMNPGSEILAAVGLYNGLPWPYSQNWFRYAIYNDPNWDPASYTLVKDGAFAGTLNPGDIGTWPSNLSSYQQRGGKIIMFHGQQDNQITSFHTPIFYDRLGQGMGYSVEQMDKFLRFFRISGMFHCSTGPGAWVIGQGGGASSLQDNVAYESEHNVLAAIVDWVELGAPPDTITGTKFVNDTADLGVAFQRRHCRWPKRNVFVGGERDPSSPDSWKCITIS